MESTISPAPEGVGRRVAEELLSRRGFMIYEVGEVRSLHYAEACAALGALRLAAALGDRALAERVAERYAPAIFGTEPTNTANHVDANVFGVLPLELYRVTGDVAYLERGLALADGQWKDPLPNGMTNQTRYWIDDVYMIACLQAQAFRATGDQAYLDRAALEVEAYLDRLQEANGLFHHGPEAPFFWGRGNGWVAAGLAELLAVLPETHPRYQAIRKGYLRMASSLLRYQRGNGMWGQLLDRDDSWEESSCTAMFAYALAVGSRLGLIDGTDAGRRCDAAWKALLLRVGPDGKLDSVCAGTGQNSEASYYLERPRVAGDLHGQAALLWLAAERLDMERPKD